MFTPKIEYLTREKKHISYFSPSITFSKILDTYILLFQIDKDKVHQSSRVGGVGAGDFKNL